MRNTLKRKYSKLLVVLLIISFLLSTFFIFCTQKSYYAVLPVKFDDINMPYVNVMIEDVNVSLGVDLGSRLEMEIYPEVLGQFYKRAYGTEKWKNFRGTEFEYPTYTLPRIEIGSLTFKNPIVVEFPSEANEESIIWEDLEQEKSSPRVVGQLGRGLLKKVNLLLDMECSKMILTNSVKKLKNDGYDLKTFEKVPFKLGPKGIVIEIETDQGKVKLLLDTGCTWTMLHDFLYPEILEKKFDRHGFPIYKSDKFIINKRDFGSKELYFLKMTEELNDIDGFLGMDFIKKHVMYIDFEKQYIYIKPPSSKE